MGRITMQHTSDVKGRDVQAPPLTGIPRRNGHDRARNVNLTPARDLKADLAETTASIIAKCGDPARVLEFYYWSREPGLSDLIRAFLALPATSRTALGAFLAKTPDPQLISIKAEKGGRLTFSPPRAPKAKKLKDRR
jgi:hypothetical protein